MNAIMQFARRDQVSTIPPSMRAWWIAWHPGTSDGHCIDDGPWIGLRGVFLLSAFLILSGWLLSRRVSAPVQVEN